MSQTLLNKILEEKIFVGLDVTSTEPLPESSPLNKVFSSKKACGYPSYSLGKF